MSELYLLRGEFFAKKKIEEGNEQFFVEKRNTNILFKLENTKKLSIGFTDFINNKEKFLFNKNFKETLTNVSFLPDDADISTYNKYYVDVVYENKEKPIILLKLSNTEFKKNDVTEILQPDNNQASYLILDSSLDGTDQKWETHFLKFKDNFLNSATATAELVYISEKIYPKRKRYNRTEIKTRQQQEEQKVQFEEFTLKNRSENNKQQVLLEQNENTPKEFNKEQFEKLKEQCAENLKADNVSYYQQKYIYFKAQENDYNFLKFTDYAAFEKLAEDYITYRIQNNLDIRTKF